MTDASAVAQALLAMARQTGAPPLPPTSEPPRSEGMDPWQQSVEARLSSLDARLGKIDPNIADIKTDTAVLKATVASKADLTTLGDRLLLRMQIYAGLMVGAIAVATAVSKYL